MAQQVDIEESPPHLKLSHSLLPRREIRLFQLETALTLPENRRGRARPDDAPLPPLQLQPVLAVRRESASEPAEVPALALPITAVGLAANQVTDEDDEDEVPLPMPARGPVPTVPPQQAPAQTLASGARRPEDDLPDLSGEQWEMAPIRWSGQIMSNMNRSWDDKDNSTSSVGQTNMVNASSYIYAPWFAQTTGNATYSTVRSWSRKDDDIEKVSETSAEGKSYGFGGGLSLFPMSAFPFQTYYNYSRNKAQAENSESKNIASQFGLSQSFRSADGVDSFSYNYNRSSSKMAGPNTMANSASALYSTRVGDDHTLNATASYNDEESGRDDVMKKNWLLTANHAWRVDEGLNINSNANLTQTENDVFQEGDDRAKNRSQVLQFNSNVSWQPYDDEDEPLPMIVSGGGTFLNIEQDAPDASKSRTTVLSGNGSMTYRFTNQLSGNANGNLTRVDSNSAQNTFYGTGAGLNYAGMPTPLVGGLIHSWSTGANTNISRSTSDHGTDIATANFSQSLMLPLPSLTFSANQSLSGNRTSSYGVVNTLSHSLSLSKQLGAAEEMASGQINANLGHHKTAGVTGGHSNSFTLMANGKLQISRRQELTMNANVTWMKQVQQKQELSPSLLVVNNAVVDIDEARWVGSASFTYGHMAPFDVRNLSYRANLMFSSTETSQQQSLTSFFGAGGPVNPLFSPGLERHWIHSMIFNQSLTYLIGRLNFQLSNVISRVDGVDNVMIFGHVARRFGTF